MAKYTVTCPTCGSDYRVDLVGPHKDREYRLDNWDWTCDECKVKARQKENAKAAAANAALGLPSLTGSEKMIAWAETIRKQKIAAMDEEIEKGGISDSIDDARFNAALTNLKNRTSARWWIDNRDVRGEHLLRQEYQTTEKPLPPDEAKIAEEAKIEALAEATVRPPTPITETVAEIRVKGNAIEIFFLEKREDFRKIVRFGLGYTWSEARWRRELKPTNGTSEDRAAEAGNRLLAAGFPIRIFDDNLRVRAVCGTYEPELRRWVMARASGTYNGWFAISWPKEEEFYKAARRLKSSRYDKPFVVVPAEQFQEVLDFAEMYQFSISAGAQRVIEAAREVRARALTAFVAVPSDRKLRKAEDKPGHLDVPENVDIADEFREDIR